MTTDYPEWFLWFISALSIGLSCFGVVIIFLMGGVDDD